MFWSKNKKNRYTPAAHTCNEFEKGIMEIFLPFQGDF